MVVGGRGGANDEALTVSAWVREQGDDNEDVEIDDDDASMMGMLKKCKDW